MVCNSAGGAPRSFDRGRERLLASPSLRTGRADLPHPALQLVVLPTRGLTGQGMGSLQAVEPVLGKEGVGPALTIRSPHDASHPPMGTQHTAQAAAYPAVERGERRAVAVLEVDEPAPQPRIEVVDDRPQASARGPTRLGTDGILELLQALVARPVTAVGEAVAQELKALRPRVDQVCLGWVQGQAGLRRPVLDHRQGSGRLCFTATQHHEVVGIAHHLEALPGHRLVQWVEVDVAQQRRDHRALRRAFLGRPRLQAIEDALPQELAQQLHDLPIRYLPADLGQQVLVRDRVEVALQISIDDEHRTVLQQLVDPPQGILAAPAGAEAVAVGREVPLEDRFQHHPQRRLNYPVSHRRYAERPLLRAPRFGNVVPANRLRPVLARPQPLAQPTQIVIQLSLEHLHRDVVHSARPMVGLHARKRRPQGPLSVDLVHQAIPLASSHPLREGRQHAFRPHRRFGVAPGGSLGFSGTYSLFGHCHRCPSIVRVRHVSTFLPPFAPPALPGFSATMSALTPVTRLELAGAAQVSPLNVSGLRSLPSPPTSPLPMVAFAPNPSAPGAFPLFAGPGFALRSQARHAARPYRVRYPTDDFFTFRCSPPRLAATQLRLITGRSGLAWRGLPP